MRSDPGPRRRTQRRVLTITSVWLITAAAPLAARPVAAAPEVGAGLVASSAVTLTGWRGTLTSIACATDGSCIVAGSTDSRTGAPNPGIAPDKDLDGAVLRSTDTGRTWSPVAIPPGLRQVTAVDCTATACIASAYSADTSSRWRLLRSADGGATWTVLPTSIADTEPPLVECVIDACFAVVQPTVLGNDSTVLRSDASGTSWTFRSLIVGEYTSLECADSMRCIRNPGITGAPSRTTDGGLTWTELDLPPDVHSIAVTDCIRERCYAQFDMRSGVDRFTEDLGVTWVALPASSRPLQRLACASTRCFATSFEQITLLADAAAFVGTPTFQPDTSGGLNRFGFDCPADDTCVSLADDGARPDRFVERFSFTPVPIIAVSPQRLLDTRASSLTTVDGAHHGEGRRPSGSTYTLPVRGRGSIAASAGAVTVTVTATAPLGPGFVTVHPCDRELPTASNVNFVEAGQTVANAVTVPLAADGTICLYTSEVTDLVVDANAYMPAAVPGITPLQPARLLETRTGRGLTTVDGLDVGQGAFTAGETRTLAVRGRGGVDDHAVAVTLNVAAVDPIAPGFLTVFPCDRDRPTSSNVNHRAGRTASNAVTVPLTADGTVCIYSLASAHVVVDVTAFVPSSAADVAAVAPARLLDTRSGAAIATVDGRMVGGGMAGPGERILVPVAGRGQVPFSARTVTLTITVTEATGGGYLTVSPCPTSPPLASNLNYDAGDTIANAVTVPLADGDVCIDVLTAAHVVMDVNGYSL